MNLFDENVALKGSDYWKKKFRKLIQAIARKYKIEHDGAGRKLAERLACLDLLPYHSCSRPTLRRLKDLPSVQAMLDFIRSANLIERAKGGKVLVIVVRGKKYWEKALDLEGHRKNVVVYNPKNQARQTSCGVFGMGSRTEHGQRPGESITKLVAV